jgi:hypothetical protein
VETFSYLPWMAARARRLRLYRLLANSFWYWLVLLLFSRLLIWAVPQVRVTLGFILRPFALLLGLLVIPWLLISSGFQCGAIKCPSCDARFTPKFWPWIPKCCQNCRYDIYALRHRGDF